MRLKVPVVSGAGSSWVWVRDTITGAWGEAVVGTDNAIYIARKSSFYRYHPADNSWTMLVAPPNPDAGDAFKTGTALAWDFGDYIYALYGAATDDSRRWFYRYSISGNSWQALTNTTYDQGEGDTITWVGLDNRIYATIGGEQRATYFLRYDPTSNTWSDVAVTDPPAGMGDGASLVWTGIKYLFALRGEFYETTALYDFWRYDLTTDTWMSMADIPADPHDGGTGGVGDGGSLLYIGLWLSDQTDFIYALSGNQAYPESPPVPDNRFYRYTISTDSWERLTDLPFGVGYYVGCRLGYANGHIYAWQGAPSTWAEGGDDLGRYEFPAPVPPVADFSYSPDLPAVDATVNFDASASYDPDGGDIINYSWDFGDGTYGAGQKTSHVYTAVGSYTVTLTVTDDESQTDTDFKSIVVGKASSVITISVNPAYVEIGMSTTISGSITPTRSGVSVTIWHRLSGEITWNALTTVITNGESKYSYDWAPTAIGAYELRASWAGDDKTLPAESEIKTVIVTPPDSTPPTTYINLSGAVGDNGWFTSTVSVTLSAVDDISGVDKTEYSFDNAIWTTYTTPFTIMGEGSTLIYYKSTDKAGNPETIKTETIKMDKTIPSGSIMINNNAAYATSSSVTLTLTASDATSGVYRVRFSNDGVWGTEPWEPSSLIKTWTLTSGDGNKTVYYQIKDNAGLIATHSDTIILDTALPTGSITIAGDATYANSSSVTLTLSATDTTSGVAQMRFSNNNVTWSDWEAYATSKSWTLTTGDGTKTVYVQYKDKAGLISQSYQDTIILDTTKPTANAGSDQTVNEDTLVTLDGSTSQDENGIQSYTWTFTDVTPQTLTGKNPTYNFTTPGAYSVTLMVTDPAGNTATGAVTITVLDVTKPVANAGSDQTVNEDSPITLDGSASSDNVGITAYTWTFTDGATKTLTEEKPTYTFNTPGVYTITLNVTDAEGNWATDTIIITALDITKPVANAGQDQTVNVGTTVTFDAGASSDNVGIVSYQWDFGDETTGTGKTVTHTYANPGTYTVTLTVKDAAGNSAIHSIGVTVLAAGVPLIWIIGVIVVIATIGIALVATLLLRKRKIS